MLRLLGSRSKATSTRSTRSVSRASASRCADCAACATHCVRLAACNATALVPPARDQRESLLLLVHVARQPMLLVRRDLVPLAQPVSGDRVRGWVGAGRGVHVEARAAKATPWKKASMPTSMKF